jgi:hypothetical protein
MGALAGGVALSPAAQAATADSSAAQTAAQAPFRHFFGPYYSGYHGNEHRSDRSYFKGYWFKDNGRYYFSFDGFDRDRDHQYSYYWVRYHDGHGFHTNVYRDFDRFHYSHIFSRSSGFNDFQVRVCEGGSPNSDCGSYHNIF